MCGTSHGTRVTDRVEGKRWLVLDSENYWLKPLAFDPDKPFGIIQEAAGRGSLQVVGHFSPEDDPSGSFQLIKKRLLQMVTQWISKGWLTSAEVLAAAGTTTSTRRKRTQTT
jgi:hypothetical protein